jgi:hypothetical protein
MKAGAGAFDIDDFVSKLITFMGGRRAGGAGGPKDRPAQDEETGADEDDDEEEDDEDDEPLNWERIGRKALAKSRRVPVMDFMCVAVAISPFLLPSLPVWLRVSLSLRALMFWWFLVRRPTGSGRWRSNRKSARWASAPDSRRTRRTSGGRRSSAKKTSRGPRTRRRNM